MVSARSALPLEACRHARDELERRGPAPLQAWRSDQAVAELRWLSGGRPQALRQALEDLVKDLLATRRADTALACVTLCQTLAVAVLDDDE